MRQLMHSERLSVMNKSSLLAHIRNLQRELNGLMDIVIAMEESEPQPTQFQQEASHDRWLTVKQVCEELHISDSTFYVWLNAGLLPEGIAFGARSKRWRMSDIRAWQESKKHDAEERPKTTVRRRGRFSRVRKIGEFCYV